MSGMSRLKISGYTTLLLLAASQSLITPNALVVAAKEDLGAVADSSYTSNSNSNGHIYTDPDAEENSILVMPMSYYDQEDIRQLPQQKKNFNPWGGKRSKLMSSSDLMDFWNYVLRSSWSPNGVLSKKGNGGNGSFNPWGGKRSSVLPRNLLLEPINAKRPSFNPWGGR